MNYIQCSSDQKKIIEIFNDFLHQFSETQPYVRISLRSWSMDGYQLEFDINKLHISTPITEIVQTYQSIKVVVLRKYQEESKCIIGCGNKPLADSGGYPFETQEEEIEYHATHNHQGCYTINPEPAYNPCTVGFFSYQKFPNIPDHSFSSIESEGVWLDGTDLYFSEINRLLKEEGLLICDHEHIMTKINGQLVTMPHINLSDYIRPVQCRAQLFH
jgi:hypothetical protein